MSKFRPARVFIKAGQTDVEVGEYEGRVGSCINPVFQKLLNSALLCPRNVLKMSPFLKLFAQILQIPFSKGLCPVPSKFVPSALESIVQLELTTLWNVCWLTNDYRIQTMNLTLQWNVITNKSFRHILN